MPVRHIPLRIVVCGILPLACALAFAVPAGAQDSDRFANAANADVDPEMRNLRAMAMAGAFVGGGTGIGALFHNPAGIMTVALYEFDGGYQRTFGDDVNAIGAAIADSKTNPSIAASFAYSFGFGNDGELRSAFSEARDEISRANDNIRDHDIRAALAFPLIPSRVAIGVGVHYVNHFRGSWRQSVSEEIEVPERDADGELTGEVTTQTQISTDDFELRHRGLTLDAGVYAQLSDNISFGIAARNLLEIRDWNHHRRLESGIGARFDAFHAEAAWFSEQNDQGVFEHGAALGVEYVVSNAPVRAGYRYENASGDSFVTSGFGYRAEKTGFDLAFEQNVSNTAERRLGFGFSLFF